MTREQLIAWMTLEGLGLFVGSDECGDWVQWRIMDAANRAGSLMLRSAMDSHSWEYRTSVGSYFYTPKDWTELPEPLFNSLTPEVLAYLTGEDHED